MAFSLYDATVANFLQTLGSVGGFLEKSRAHFHDKGVDLADVVQARLAPDMLPLRFQVISVIHHSRGALRAVTEGVFTPPRPNDEDYTTLQSQVAAAKVELSAWKPEDVDALAGRDVMFRFREMTLPFTAEGFLMSFSLPNFYFHATTAYDILRHKGAPLGKTDFMGRLKLKM
jgi:hypothetical protein